MITKIVVGAVLAALVLYGLFEAWPLILGPALEVNTPTNGQVLPEGVLRATGKAERITALTLNGAPLLTSEQGSFSATLAFPQGTSILTFTASDRFGRTITVTRNIYVPK